MFNQELPVSQPDSISTSNQLITALPNTDQARFVSACETVQLSYAEHLAEPGELIRYVYFPDESYIALVQPTRGAAGLEVGLIGDEGMLGASLVLGVHTSPVLALVQGEGTSLRMQTQQFYRQLNLSPALLSLLKRYLYVLMAQLAQTAACTRFHVVQARLARWLLMSHDRAHNNTIHATHEFLAYMLGVRRVGITKSATSLQQQGLISYSRGNIKVLNRAGLEPQHAVVTRLTPAAIPRSWNHDITS
jgi:cAMP-binding proteins - catabolite gene activator and regulatory subunit of cAMP-dependent protein kinases